jgi:hypothetical protein
MISIPVHGPNGRANPEHRERELPDAQAVEGGEQRVEVLALRGRQPREARPQAEADPRTTAVAVIACAILAARLLTTREAARTAVAGYVSAASWRS